MKKSIGYAMLAFIISVCFFEYVNGTGAGYTGFEKVWGLFVAVAVFLISLKETEGKSD